MYSLKTLMRLQVKTVCYKYSTHSWLVRYFAMYDYHTCTLHKLKYYRYLINRVCNRVLLSELQQPLTTGWPVFKSLCTLTDIIMRKYSLLSQIKNGTRRQASGWVYSWAWGITDLYAYQTYCITRFWSLSKHICHHFCWGQPKYYRDRNV